MFLVFMVAQCFFLIFSGINRTDEPVEADVDIGRPVKIPPGDTGLGDES
jgi:hypothetical protein